MDYKFNDVELADFARFWESEVGKKYFAKIDSTVKQLLGEALDSADRDQVFRNVATARGVELVLLDITATIETKKEEDKKTAKDTK